VLLEADLDEGGLHARKDVVDDALVDVAGDRAALGSLEIDLGDSVVLEDCDTLLADIDGNEEFAFRGRQRRAAGRRAPALLLGALGALPGLALGSGVLLRRRGLRLGGSRRLGLLLTATPATASASALRLRLLARRGRGRRLCCYGVGLGRAVSGRVFLALLAPEEL